jgi:ankyrin repeat protein
MFGFKKKGPLLELRNKIISREVTVEKEIGNNKVYGILVEGGLEKGSFSLICFSDGTTSLYFDKGGGIIGAGDHQNVNIVSEILLEKSDEYLKSFTLNNNILDLPDKNILSITILTKNNNYNLSSKIISDKIEIPEVSELFYYANSVLTQIRLFQERKNKIFNEDEILINFIKENNLLAIERTLKRFNNPNAILDGKNALLIATLMQNIDSIKLLKIYGSDIYFQDNSGLNSIMAASYLGNELILKEIVTEKNIDLKDIEGFTSLMYACNSGNYECVKILLENKSNVNETANDNSTPIMFAAQKGYNEIIKLLLEFGADKSFKGNHGLSALDFAKQNNLKETINLLK